MMERILSVIGAATEGELTVAEVLAGDPEDRRLAHL